MFDFQRYVFVTFALIASVSNTVTGQRPIVMEQRLPFEVKSSELGLEGLSYNGADGLLQAGDIISWVATPGSDDAGSHVTSPREQEVQPFQKQDQKGRIALWVTRGNKDPDWINVLLTIHAAPPRESVPLVNAKAITGGVEVVTYAGTDDLLSPRDVITWVSTPGSDNAGAEVTDAATFQAELRARQGNTGQVALFVQRLGNEPDWVIVPLASTRTDAGEMSIIQSRGECEVAGNDLSQVRPYPNSVGMKFVKIPAGEFLMGSPEAERRREFEERQHRVRISQPFHVMRGGSWWLQARSASRRCRDRDGRSCKFVAPQFNDDGPGFRVVCELE